jgi:hypothetical protein
MLRRAGSTGSGGAEPGGLPGALDQDGGEEVDEPGVRVVQVGGGQGRDVVPVLLDRCPAHLLIVQLFE